MSYPTPIVLLHYFSGSSASWQYVLHRLPANRPVIAIDLPGCGGSPMVPIPSIRAYSNFVWKQLTKRGIGSFILVGHSMGGKIAMDMASMQSSESCESPNGCWIEHLGLIGPSPATREPMPNSRKDELETTRPSVVTANQMIEESTIVSLDDERRQLAVQTNVETDSRVWRWWLREGMEHSIAESVSQLKLPVSILGSKDDPVIPIANIRQDVADVIAGSSFACVENVGHLMPLEDERLVADWITNL